MYCPTLTDILCAAPCCTDGHPVATLRCAMLRVAMLYCAILRVAMRRCCCCALPCYAGASSAMWASQHVGEQ